MLPYGVVLLASEPGWAAPSFATLLPGAHAVIIGGSETGIEGRRAGFELRDTITVVSSGPTVFLFRKPLAEKTVAAQVLATGTGAMNVDACRIPTTENRARFNRARVRPTGRALVPQSKGDALIDPGGDGRWPSNLVFVHGPSCHHIGTVRGASRFFPQFKNDQELLDWLTRLIAPPESMRTS